MGEGLFTSDLFWFLEDLRKHNDRAWFAKNQERYLDAVQEPALEFVWSFAPVSTQDRSALRRGHRPVGGSLFRIYRDVRFSKDKSPYKIHVGFHFRHNAGRDVHWPGFYLHLQPGEVFTAIGLWHPEREALHRIRTAIVEKSGPRERRGRREAHAPDDDAGTTGARNLAHRLGGTRPIWECSVLTTLAWAVPPPRRPSRNRRHPQPGRRSAIDPRLCVSEVPNLRFTKVTASNRSSAWRPRNAPRRADIPPGCLIPRGWARIRLRTSGLPCNTCSTTAQRRQPDGRSPPGSRGTLLGCTASGVRWSTDPRSLSPMCSARRTGRSDQSGHTVPLGSGWA